MKKTFLVLVFISGFCACQVGIAGSFSGIPFKCIPYGGAKEMDNGVLENTPTAWPLKKVIIPMRALIQPDFSQHDGIAIRVASVGLGLCEAGIRLVLLPGITLSCAAGNGGYIKDMPLGKALRQAAVEVGAISVWWLLAYNVIRMGTSFLSNIS
jgi:hypothetical protein